MKSFYLHRKFSSALFLSAYLFLFTIGIFHHHGFYKINKDIVCNSEGNGNNHKDPFSTDDSFCLLVYFSNTISNIDYFPTNFSTILNELTRVQTYDNSSYLQTEFTVVSLRAPPVKE